MKLSHLDKRLEGHIRKLYERHLELTSKIDWSYHELLPWEEGRNFKTHPWRPEQSRISPQLYLAVETALLTEVNLPYFTADLIKNLQGSLEVMQDFVRTWTSEEDQHSSVLETYLLLTRNGDPSARAGLRKESMKAGYFGPWTEPFSLMVYTTIQELATRVFYQNVAAALEGEDPALAAILRRLAKDENLHYTFYRDVVKAHLEIQPSYVYPLATVLLNFRMPGASMPGFESRMKNIAVHSNYGPAEYYTQVVDVLVRYWQIDQLHPTYALAEKAIQKIMAYRNKMARVTERFTERQLASLKSGVAPLLPGNNLEGLDGAR